jgi:hypothetical protein
MHLPSPDLGFLDRAKALLDGGDVLEPEHLDACLEVGVERHPSR